MSFIETLAQNYEKLITWLLVILGWLVVAQQNDAREIRRELRAKIDAAQSCVSKICSEALSYYSVSGSAEGLSSVKIQITMQLQDLSGCINRLVSGKRVSVVDAFVEYRKSITLNGFDDLNRSAYPIGSDRLNQIFDAASSLSEKLELLRKGGNSKWRRKT